MTLWQQHDLGHIIEVILRNAEAYIKDHHLAPPFLTPYQIAIELKQKNKDVYDALGKEIGGKGHGQHHSLSQYLARELSLHAKNETMPIEGAFLYRKHLECLAYSDDGHTIESSLGDQMDLSMFRIKQ